MKRVQLFEFEDFGWLPDWIRSSMTNVLVVLHKFLGTKEVLSNLILKTRESYPFNQIVDMGSGSGGIMPEAIASINDQTDNPIDLVLTDIHPDKSKVDYINNQKLPHVQYSSESVDATNLKSAPNGLKTMLNSFHHMPKESAKKILHTAQDNGEAILIYEIGENKIPLVLWWLLLPISLVIVFLMALFQTPFSKPITFKQIVFTYLIPIIPLLYAWDGQASIVRMYTFDDVRSMLPKASAQYTWTMEQAKKPNGKKVGYYILGLPKA